MHRNGSPFGALDARGIAALSVLVVLVQSGCLFQRHHFTEGDRCYYQAWNEGAHGRKRIIPDCDADSFESLSHRGYARDATTVWYKGVQVPGADPASFEALSGWYDWKYARDREHVYLRRYVVLGADPTTFRALRPPYSRDAKTAFCGSLPLDSDQRGRMNVLEWHLRSRGGRLDEAPERFGFSPEATERVRKLAPGDTSLVTSNDGWARIGDQFFQGCGRLPDVDPDSLEILGGWYAKDARTVYYQHHVIPDADPKSFEVTDPLRGEARDTDRTYRMGRPQ